MTDASTTDASLAGLRDVVLQDDERYIGVPMLLHTSQTLGRAQPDATDFTTASYLRQTALARELVGTGRLPDDVAASGLTPALVSLNFHIVPPQDRAEAERRIRLLAELGPAWDPEEQGVTGPRVLVAFYDGDRETGLFGAQLCAGLGLQAYFFPLFAPAPPPAPTDRLSDDELAAVVDAGHELCFHTASHRAAREVTGENLAAEVLEPFDRLTRLAGRAPRVAAWRGGARFDPDVLGDRTLREVGVTTLVSNWSVEALPVI